MKKKMSTWKLAILVPIVAGFFFVVACQDQVISEVSDVAQNSTMAVDLPDAVQKRLNDMQSANPDKEYIAIELNADGKKKLGEMANKYNITVFEMQDLSVVEDGNTRNFAIIKLTEDVKKVGDLSQNGNEVFTIVEETAMYPGGIEEFSKFVYDNIQYPAQARRMGIEGKVHVQIIVEKDGTISEVTPVKGIGAGCDAEAVRVVSMSKAWNPAKQRGKAVRQKLVIPILFKLNDESVKTVSVEPVNKKFMVETVNEKHNGGTIVKGTVTDEEGNPLPGTNIVLEGTTLGTVSDREGTFTIKMKESNGKLVLSFVGYDSQVVNF